MIDYTIAAVTKTVDDLKRIFNIFTVSLQVLCIGYLIYVLAIGAGVLAANITLLIISVFYLVLHIVTHNSVGEARARVQNVKHVLKYMKLAIRAVTLGIAVYGIYVASTHLTPVSVVLTSLMVVCWIFQIILELACTFVENRSNLIVLALKKDIENAIRPVKAVGTFIKKAAGVQCEPEPPKPEAPEWLDKRVASIREERQRVKSVAKGERELLRKQRRRERAEAFFSIIKGKKKSESTKQELPDPEAEKADVAVTDITENWRK